MSKIKFMMLLMGALLFTGLGAVNVSAADMKCGAGKCGAAGKCGSAKVKPACGCDAKAATCQCKTDCGCQSKAAKCSCPPGNCTCKACECPKGQCGCGKTPAIKPGTGGKCSGEGKCGGK